MGYHPSTVKDRLAGLIKDVVDTMSLEELLELPGELIDDKRVRPLSREERQVKIEKDKQSHLDRLEWLKWLSRKTRKAAPKRRRSPKT